MMHLQAFTALLFAVSLVGSTGLAAGQANANNVAAIQQTLSSASNNPQIADTSAQTSNSNAAVAPAKASLQQQTAPGGQNAVPAVTQADQINNALVKATNLATQIVQAAPPVSSLINPVSATPDSISLAAAPGQQVTLNPDGVTFAGSPTDSSMTIGNVGVRYNDPQENAIPGQVAGSNFPGQGSQVVQNAPLNDEGTGPAPVGGSHFKPLGTNVGGGSTPQQRTEDVLASMGQGGHNRQSPGQVAGGDKYQNNPFFRNYDDNSQRTTSYAANVPTTSSLLGGGAGANNPNAVTLTGPGGNSVSLGRRLLREMPESDL